MNNVNILKENGIDVDTGISLLGDIEMYNTIMTDFLNGYEERMKKIELYKNQGDLLNYSIEVHSLKSDSKYLGFNDLADISYKHEIASKAGDINSVTNSYDKLIEEANKIINIVKNYLKVESNNQTKVIDNIEISQSNSAILVADDSSIIRDFIKETFQGRFEVLMASDGKEVINIVSSNLNISALLLDLNMPNVDGFQVLDYFKENDLFKKIPVSIISGANDKDSIDRAFTYNIVDMINKPFNMDNVRLVVEKMLSISNN